MRPFKINHIWKCAHSLSSDTLVIHTAFNITPDQMAWKCTKILAVCSMACSHIHDGCTEKRQYKSRMGWLMSCHFLRDYINLLKLQIKVIKYRVFLLLWNDFKSLYHLHFSSDFVNRYIKLFTLLRAIEWGIDHNSSIPRCRVSNQYVKAAFFVKTDFS